MELIKTICALMICISFAIAMSTFMICVAVELFKIVFLGG